MHKLKRVFTMWSALALFLLSGTAMAQTVAINNVTAQSPVHYADDADFSVGTLTITFNMPTGLYYSQGSYRFG